MMEKTEPMITPKEFVQLWNKLHQAVKQMASSGSEIKPFTLVMSLDLSDNLVDKVNLVVSRYLVDEDYLSLHLGLSLEVVSTMNDVVILTNTIINKEIHEKK